MLGARQHERRVNLVGEDARVVFRADLGDPRELAERGSTRPVGLCGLVRTTTRVPLSIDRDQSPEIDRTVLAYGEVLEPPDGVREGGEERRIRRRHERERAVGADEDA